MDISMQYISSGKLETSSPLQRFLPPVAEGVARSFIQGLKPSTGWILDPFAALPRQAVEMARSGHKVLVTAGNPVSRFLLDLAAHPPKQPDLQAALADLAAARKEGKRLETHLQSLYFTSCDNCHRELSAEAFLWDGKTGALVGRIYNCVCGSGGEHPATFADIENAARWALTDGLHRSRALERVAPGTDPDRPFAEEALSFYLPRAVYAIGMIVNRLDGLSPSQERRRCMSALLLHALDYANALWPHTTERPHPRQLSLPPIYRENNLWLALEAGVKAWASPENSIPLTLWPDEPPDSGGLCIFEGHLRDLLPEMEGIPIKAVVAAIPRPNQAFWTLSALWSGWLWGHEAVGPFKSALRRRRYDWQWHAGALKALFGNLAEIILPETPFFGMLADPEVSFASAVILAGQVVGFEITGIAMRAETEPIQVLWKKTVLRDGAASSSRKNMSGGKVPGHKNKIQQLDVRTTFNVAREILEKINEPLPYLQLHVLILAALAEKDLLQFKDDSLTILEKTIFSALASPEFVDLEGRSSPETGRWALSKWDQQGKLAGL